MLQRAQADSSNHMKILKSPKCTFNSVYKLFIIVGEVGLYDAQAFLKWLSKFSILHKMEAQEA